MSRQDLVSVGSRFPYHSSSYSQASSSKSSQDKGTAIVLGLHSCSPNSSHDSDTSIVLPSHTSGFLALFTGELSADSRLKVGNLSTTVSSFETRVSLRRSMPRCDGSESLDLPLPNSITLLSSLA